MDTWNMQMQGAQQLQKQAATEQADPYDRHRQAVAEWQTACRELARAEALRAHAKDALDKASQILATHLHEMVQDPTQPVSPMNGQANPVGGGLRQF